MSSQALSRKWRAQTFDGILGQEHITRTLRNQIRAGRVGHAYLFAGVRGTGKTSTARILAKAVNCIGDTDDPPCDHCSVCRSITDGTSLDLVEIDAASNRGIDEIRDLRDKVNYMPHECRYKVLVIDEVHMLTNEAFNALLKTLEEPPEHVIFVLCTTEAHRLPDTILSRCQRFEFRRAPQRLVRQKLEYICAQEGLQVADDALTYMARRGAGSFRDAESLLDQVAAYGGTSIDLALVQTVLGAVPYRLVLDISRSVVLGDIAGGIHAIAVAFDSGADPRQLLAGLVEQLRALLLMRVGTAEDTLLVEREEAEDLRSLLGDPAFSLRRLVRAIRLFSEAGEALRTAARPEIPLELALVEAVEAASEGSDSPLEAAPVSAHAGKAAGPRHVGPSAGAGSDHTASAGSTPRIHHETTRVNIPAAAPPASLSSTTDAKAERQTLAVPTISAPEVNTADRPVAATAREGTSETPSTASRSRAPASTGLTLEVVQGNWARVVAKMRAQSPQLQAMLRSVYPVAVSGDLITLACDFPFHRDRLSEEKRRSQVEEVLGEVLAVACRVECVVDREARTRYQADEADGPRDLFTAAETEEERRRQLLNHPAVKDLTERGGRIRRVELNPNNSSKEKPDGQ